MKKVIIIGAGQPCIIEKFTELGFSPIIMTLEEAQKEFENSPCIASQLKDGLIIAEGIGDHFGRPKVPELSEIMKLDIIPERYVPPYIPPTKKEQRAGKLGWLNQHQNKKRGKGKRR